jgi:hypothetical protein
MKPRFPALLLDGRLVALGGASAEELNELLEEAGLREPAKQTEDRGWPLAPLESLYFLTCLRPLLIRRCPTKAEAHFQPAAFSALGPNAAALSLHQPLADRQTEALAARLLRRSVGPVEAVEDQGQLLRGDARAAVQDADDDFLRPGRTMTSMGSLAPPYLSALVRRFVRTCSR